MTLLHLVAGLGVFCALLTDYGILGQFAQDIDVGWAHVPPAQGGGSQRVLS